MQLIVMPGKQAKIVTPLMLRRVLRYASRTAFPARDRAMILLSVKAGLAPARLPASIGRWSSARSAT